MRIQDLTNFSQGGICEKYYKKSTHQHLSKDICRLLYVYVVRLLHITVLSHFHRKTIKLSNSCPRCCCRSCSWYSCCCFMTDRGHEFGFQRNRLMPVLSLPLSTNASQFTAKPDALLVPVRCRNLPAVFTVSIYHHAQVSVFRLR